jgi:hypothetical protein
MPKRLSEIRAGVQNLEIDDGGIVLNLTDYGTVQSGTGIGNATSNGTLVKKAYIDALKYRTTTRASQIITISCPSGNYYFPDDDLGGNLFALDLANPYGNRIRIQGAIPYNWQDRPTSPDNLSTFAGLTTQQRYESLAAFFGTRFYFTRNGINGRVCNPGYAFIPGLLGIGIFGRQSSTQNIGTFNTSDTFFARGIGGSLDMSLCAVHGFGNFTFTPPTYTPANSGWGIGVEGGNNIFSSGIIISDCGRGLHVQRNGSFTNFSTFESVCNNEFGVLVTDNGMAYLGGEGSSMISHNGVHGVNVFAGGIVRFGEGTTEGEVSHTVKDSGSAEIFIRTNGLVVYESGDLTPTSADTAQGGQIYAKT